MNEDILNTEFNNLTPIPTMVEEAFTSPIQNKDDNNIYQPDGKINASILIKNAKILLAAGDTKLAKNIFRVLIEHGEKLGTAYAGLAATFELEKKYDLAIKAYREAIIYEPCFGSLNALAELYVTKEDYRNAIGTLLRILNLAKIDPEQVFEIQKLLGNCYLNLGQLEHAEQHYRTAYEMNPNSDLLHTNIGSLALQKNDAATATLHFKEALRLNTSNTKALIGVGLAYLSQGNNTSAYDAFLAAIKIDNQNINALFNLVKCAYELKKYEEISPFLKQYINNNPTNSNLLYSYAGILFHQNKYSEAKEECERLLQLNPEHQGAKKILALIDAK